jgi:hypothetical protein
MKYLRTCLKCGENLYSAGEYSDHLKTAHGKLATKSEIGLPRKVATTMADTGQDVPKEILVKPAPKDKETPKKAVKSRQTRSPKGKSDKKSETTADAKE